MELTHVRLLAQDFEACFRFYRDVMGFPVLWGDVETGYVNFEASAGVRLALFGRREMAEVVGTARLPEQALCQDRAMLILATKDLEATLAELKARGAEIALDAAHYPGWGIRAAYLRDPDGTLIELNSPLPQAEWSEGLQQASQRFEPE